jgi:hypothetical protein
MAVNYSYTTVQQSTETFTRMSDKRQYLSFHAWLILLHVMSSMGGFLSFPGQNRTGPSFKPAHPPAFPSSQAPTPSSVHIVDQISL